MKRLIAAVMAAMAAMFAIADEEITMVEQEITSITVPFGIRGYTPSNKDVVRIEMTSENSLRITALKSGRCDLEVRGDMDMTQKFQISVGGDLPRTLATLRRELERMPEVHADIVGNSIRIDGEVKSIKKWNYLTKVIKSYPSVRNFAEFTPGDEILIRMKESLQQSGFEVVFNQFTGEPKTWKANCVALAYSKVNRTMTVQAKVYTPEQQEKIMECLKQEKRWLAIDKADSESFDDELQVKANIQVTVDKPVIRLSVAYMAISEDDIKKIGNQNAIANPDSVLSLNGAFDTLQSLIPHTDSTRSTRHGVRNTATLGATLGLTARFLAANGISRISDTGYTLVESWSPDGAKFKSGGTVFVKIAGADAADLKEIPYGFIINAKGGMTNEDTMALDFDFEQSSIGDYDPVSQSFARTENTSKQKLSCPLGRTTLVSGFKDMVDKNTPPSGLPILRSTPILNWFVSDSGKEVNDRRLVVMICPEIVDNTQDEKPDVDKEINIRVQDQASKDTDQVVKEREEKEGFSGFWSWLNWFRF